MVKHKISSAAQNGYIVLWSQNDRWTCKRSADRNWLIKIRNSTNTVNFEIQIWQNSVVELVP